MKTLRRMFVESKHSYAMRADGTYALLEKNERWSAKNTDVSNKNKQLLLSRTAKDHLNKHPEFESFIGCENLLTWPQLRLMKKGL